MIDTFALLVAFRPPPPTESLSYSPVCFWTRLTLREETFTFYELFLAFSVQAEDGGAGGGLWHWE
jgi:hypothetical protein